MMITANPRPFSVLMSLYARESPAALEVALASLTRQTLQPDETVIVLDGPVRKDHLDVLQRYESALAMKIVALDKNVGLARALAAGLEQCKHEWIARFDTDDWSHPERFARQHAFLDAHPTVGLLGSWIGEFEANPKIITRVRSVPLTHEAIVRYARRRNPFNHMTVMYQRSAVQAVGGYRDLPWMEDYWLWVRMLHAGVEAANQSDLLVHARAGLEMIARRGGAAYVRSEWMAQRQFCLHGFISPLTAITNFLLRAVPRLLPTAIRGRLYAKALRTKTKAQS
ncbi:glycosyltransferase [Ralstonia sp. 22086]|uniref:glycosyltransferase n=1 Tax=Ralstonia sp. 22086 TaxID=3453870 RepID=UPI003F84EE7E